MSVRGKCVWLNCARKAICVVLSFSFLLHINTPPSTLPSFLVPLALFSSSGPRQRADESCTLLSVLPLISFSRDSELQRKSGALSQHGFIDLYITDTHPRGVNESRLVSPVGPGEAFLVFNDRSARRREHEDSVFLTLSGARRTRAQGFANLQCRWKIKLTHWV